MQARSSQRNGRADAYRGARGRCCPRRDATLDAPRHHTGLEGRHGRKATARKSAEPLHRHDPRKVGDMSTGSLSLDEQHAIRNATAWYPQKREGAGQPDTITGELVALDSVWSDYHEESRIVAVVRSDDGAMWSVRTYPARLHDEWLQLKPQIGERVSVKFAGMLERKKDGKPYPDFSVAVERDRATRFDYDRMGSEVFADATEEETYAATGDELQHKRDERDDDVPF